MLDFFVLSSFLCETLREIFLNLILKLIFNWKILKISILNIKAINSHQFPSHFYEISPWLCNLINSSIRQLKSTLSSAHRHSAAWNEVKRKKIKSCKIIIGLNWVWNEDFVFVHEVNLSTIANGCYLLSDCKHIKEKKYFMTQSCLVASYFVGKRHKKALLIDKNV